MQVVSIDADQRSKHRAGRPTEDRFASHYMHGLSTGNIPVDYLEGHCARGDCYSFLQPGRRSQDEVQAHSVVYSRIETECLRGERDRGTRFPWPALCHFVAPQSLCVPLFRFTSSRSLPLHGLLPHTLAHPSECPLQYLGTSANSWTTTPTIPTTARAPTTCSFTPTSGAAGQTTSTSTICISSKDLCETAI